jgi:hypothetical protein
VDVAVLEAAERPGLGAFGQGPGLAMGWLHDHPHRLEQALGVERAGELQAFIEGGHALAAELSGAEAWRPCEGILLPGDEREADELRRSLGAETGPPARVLEAASLRAEHGVSALAAGVTRAPAALFQPLTLLSELAQQAAVAGAKLVTSTPAVTLDDSGDRPVLLTPAARIEAELVLICGGPGAATLDPSLAAWLLPVGHFALRVELPEAVACGLPIASWYGQLRARSLGDGSWLLAGGRRSEGEPGFPPRLEGALVAMLCGLLDREPMAARVSHRWVRDAAHTRDGLPLVGPVPGRVRRILCTGFCDHDGDLAFAAARAVCEGVLGRPSELPGCLQSRRVLGT